MIRLSPDEKCPCESGSAMLQNRIFLLNGHDIERWMLKVVHFGWDDGLPHRGATIGYQTTDIGRQI
jgi:hypothetical protein